MKRCTLLLGLLAGCMGPMESGERLVSPFDGEDAVPVDAPLRLIGYARTLVPDSIPPDLLQVVSLDEGGFVKGTVSRKGDDLLFTPDDGWSADGVYHWHINESGSPPRTATWDLDAKSGGDLSFSCRDGARPIEMIRTDSGVCVLYSAALGEAPQLALAVDGVETDATWSVIKEVDVSPLSETPKGALSFVCSAGALVQGDVAVTTPGGQVLRSVGEDVRMEDVVLRRRRGVL